MLRALTLREAGALIGRSPDWLRDNWRLWHKTHRFPRPVLEHGTHVWDLAQLCAWLDRDLPPRQAAAAAAFRAAYLAALAADPAAADDLAAWRDRLARRRAANDRAVP